MKFIEKCVLPGSCTASDTERGQLSRGLMGIHGVSLWHGQGFEGEPLLDVVEQGDECRRRGEKEKEVTHQRSTVDPGHLRTQS